MKRATPARACSSVSRRTRSPSPRRQRPAGTPRVCARGPDGARSTSSPRRSACSTATGSAGTARAICTILEQLVPDAAERERVMDVARRVMAHLGFLRVRDVIWRRLQFTDHLSRREIPHRHIGHRYPGRRTSFQRSVALQRRNLRSAFGFSVFCAEGRGRGIGRSRILASGASHPFGGEPFLT